MSRYLNSIALFVSLGWPAQALAVDFVWTGPGFGGPGGNFRNSQNWTFTPPPFPLVAAPGGADDTANFDLGRDPEDRYTVTNVSGENDQLLIHDDSLRLEIGDYQLLSADEDNPSLLVGVISGDEADVILGGVGNATLRTNETVIGLGVASVGEMTVDHLQWEIDGGLNVGGRADSVGDVGGNGTLTIQNGSLVASDNGGIGRTDGSIGEIVVDASSWTVAEGVAIGNGIQGSGTLSIRNGGTVVSRNGSSSAGAIIIEGPGSMWSTTDILTMIFAPGPTLTVRDGGTLIVGADGTGALSGNSSTEFTLDSGGVLDVRGPMNTNTGPFNFLGGTLHVESLDDNLVNQGGTLAPGSLDQPAGSTTITGNYTHQSAATLQIEIGGTNAGTERDFVNVEGTALLAGMLELVLIDDFVPDPGDQLVTFNSESLLLGTFSNVADGQRLDTVDGLGSFLVHYGPTSTFNANQVVLSDFLPALPGDYNQNGTVDAADYTLWRNHLGQTFMLTNENPAAATPGIVDVEDYDFWRTHFGEMAGSASGATTAVPEPPAAIVLAVGLFVAPAQLRRRSTSP